MIIQQKTLNLKSITITSTSFINIVVLGSGKIEKQVKKSK